MFLPSPQCNSPGRKLLYLSSGDPPNDPNVPNVEEIKTFQRHNWGLLTQQIDSKFKSEKFNFEEYLIFCVRMFNVFAFARELQKTGVSQQLKIWAGFCGIFPQQIFPITFVPLAPLLPSQKHHFSFAAGKGVLTVSYGRRWRKWEEKMVSLRGRMGVSRFCAEKSFARSNARWTQPCRRAAFLFQTHCAGSLHLCCHLSGQTLFSYIF